MEEKKFDALYDLVVGMNERMLNMDEKIQTMDNRIQGLDDKVQAMDDKIQAMDSEIKSMKVEIQSINKTLDQLENDRARKQKATADKHAQRLRGQDGTTWKTRKRNGRIL